MATSAQQTSQAGSSRSVGSTVAQTQSQFVGVMASQPLVLSPEEIAIQQAALQKAQLQKALGEIKAEKDRLIRRRARLQRRQADISELEEMDQAELDDPVRALRSILLGVIEMQDQQTAILQDIQHSLAVLVRRAQAAPPPSGPSAWPVENPPPFAPPVTGVSPYTAPVSVQPVSLGIPLTGGLSAGLSLQVPVQTLFTQTVSQVAVSVQPAVSQSAQPQGTQPQQSVQQPAPLGPQPGVMQGPGQSQWVPKTAIAAPKPFTGDKRGEDLDTWLRAVPVYVKCKLTLPHEEVLAVASYLAQAVNKDPHFSALEGSATRWLSGLVQLQGYGHDFRAWVVTQKLDDFLKLVEDRWHDPREAQKDTDVILTLHTRQLKSVRDATDVVERPICVPGVRFDPQVLLTSYLRCFPMPLRSQLAGEPVKMSSEIEGVVPKYPDLFEEPTGVVEREVVHAIEIIPGSSIPKGRIYRMSPSELDELHRYGLYEFVVMPFGLCNAPDTFQHAMNRIFHDYLNKFVIVYLDDILIFSKTVEEHVAHLDKVMTLLRQHKFKINGEKREFGRTRILYLSHEISSEGLKPDDAKVANIRDWPRPQSVTFLGMTGYYCNFVKNYSIVAAPLTDLTRLDTPWEWTDRCEAAFRHLKHALTHHEVLKLPDPDKPFVVTTNASQYGIGAVLAQQEGKKLRPVEYMSKKMPSQKLAKSTYEKELYAIYKALTHWRHCLFGRFFYVRTDHRTLKWMRTQPVLSDTLKRWIEVIEQYDFEPQVH
ncbi:hypothetical protein CBR_g49340 [Chara braunii]|uniref:Reverse transcriptase domain-containing protein n=1 Tax=Chara braunii TaxID=69332 RepID=A0A388M4S5_CHABU|nr:hypothetical protein CBR_g49340 [Chara braunii]|eukprot:GBG89551.1 hypothetical protein CBR_g49340 [Chara braunii]